MNFVPTMGALHKGHRKLIESAKNLSGKMPRNVLVSIFVNPLQFGINEDFQKYPRDFTNDISIAHAAGADAIWAPDNEDIFPGGRESNFQIKAPENLQSNLCGAFRPGHFDGVSTVIIRLLKLTKPEFLFLGEKDWQQLVIIRKLINDLNFPVKIIGVPTVRDQDGLAYSSRNIYLSKNDKLKAIALPNELKKASKNYANNKNINIREIKASLKRNGLEIEYIQTVHPESLIPVPQSKRLCLLAAAVRCGNTRLIDHTFLMKRNPIVAIDGPAGVGKSSVTRAFSQRLGLLYLDTGAMYRAVTWVIQEKQIDAENDKLLAKLLEGLKIELTISKSGEQNILLNGKNISEEIRSPEVTAKVPLIATKKIVREKLTSQQKELGKNGGLVAEGRDIGTAVFPDAELKIFLNASPKERALRRSIDLKNRGFDVPDLIDLENQIKERDQVDSSREIAPLKKARDAKEVFTDGMNIEEVIEHLIELFRLNIPEEVWPTPSN